MERNFSRVLQELIRATSIREGSLADSINYDVTSLSKWVNGVKLPSERNAGTIIFKLSVCFSDAFSPESWKRYAAQHGLDANAAGDERADKLDTLLNAAYEQDRSYTKIRVPDQKSLNLIFDRENFFLLIEKAVRQLTLIDRSEVRITMSLNPFRVFGKRFFDLLNIAAAAPEEGDHDTRRISITTVLPDESYPTDSDEFCRNILSTIFIENEVQLKLRRGTSNQPNIIMLGQLMYVQILYQDRDRFAACYSVDPEIVPRFRKIVDALEDSSLALLDPASPENLRKTNVQIDSYSDTRMRFLFNEAPSMLIPNSVLAELWESPECRPEYADYLKQLDYVFTNYTSHATIDLMLYASALNKYVRDGIISIGNVEHRFTQKQVFAHIENIARILRDNPEFQLYLIRDTVAPVVKLKTPSIFIDSYEVTIENSFFHANSSYHISMDPTIRKWFTDYYDGLKERPYCTQISADEVLRFLR